MEKIRDYTTIHTSRTLMFAELSKVMTHSLEDDKYFDSLSENIANKLTKSNQIKTARYLKQLYDFDLSNAAFVAFKYFWQITDIDDKAQLALLYGLNKDYLLIESIPVIADTPVGDKVSIEKFEENIEKNHPGRFTANTRLSVAQNIASSWKQTGFITGKVKNTRTQPNISYHSVAFAFLMSYFNEDRGDFIITSKWSKALCLGNAQLRGLAIEAAKRDLLQYQYAGSVTAISFNNLFIKLGIYGIEN